jgi:hypothetical protein
MNSDEEKVGLNWLKSVIKKDKKEQKAKQMTKISFLITIFALIYFLYRVFYSL